MGKFVTDKVTVRVLPEITIIFEAPRRIVVVPTTPPARTPVRFSIPWPRKGDYTRVWKNFRKQMWRQKRLTLEHCIRLAARSGIIDIGPLSHLDLGQKLVEVKHDGWSIIGRGGRLTL